MSFRSSHRIRPHLSIYQFARRRAALVSLAAVVLGMALAYGRAVAIQDSQAMKTTLSHAAPSIDSSSIDPPSDSDTSASPAVAAADAIARRDANASQFALMQRRGAARSAKPSKAPVKKRSASTAKPKHRFQSLERLENRELLTNWYVAPDGSASNKGTIDSPWDIGSALANTRQVAPGDNVLLMGGTYYCPNRSTDSHGFGINLQGSATAPITVKPYGSQHVIVDGGLFTNVNMGFNPSHVTIMGLEVLASEKLTESRVSTQSASLPTDIAGPLGGIDLESGTDLKIINNVIHASMGGIGLWSGVAGGVLYGNVIYDIGWDAPDRGHGHAIYTQNNGPATDYITNNIMFDTYDIGFQAYGSAAAQVHNYDIEGNFAGAMHSGAGSRFLIGGDNPIEDIRVLNNVVYPGNLSIGYNLAGGNNMDVENNTAVQGAVQFQPGFTNLINQNNFSWSTGYTSPNNGAAVPSSPVVSFEANKYDRNRAYLSVIDFHNSQQVQVAVGSFLKAGDGYQIMDPANIFGAPLASGTYDGSGSISVALTATNEQIYGANYSKGQTFVVLRQPAPVASDQKTNINLQSPQSINILSGVQDPDGHIDPTSVEVVGAPSLGTASVNAATGQVTYTPAPTSYGLDTFSYKVRDAAGAWSNVATVTVDITPQDSNSMARCIRWLYFDVLERQPSAEELQNWLGVTQKGVSLDQVATTVSESTEHRTHVIDQLYQEYLGRPADSSGVNHWLGVWAATGGPNQIQDSMIGSPEYFAHSGAAQAAWVRALYQNVLGRSASQSEVNYWTGQLRLSSRDAVAQGFVGSLEYRLDQVKDWYGQYLRRDIDSSAAHWWANQLGAGLSSDAAQSTLLGSQEYEAARWAT